MSTTPERETETAWCKRRRRKGRAAAGLLVSLLFMAPATPATLSGVAATPNTWSPVASMSVVRSGHTATLLTNGMVLVAGDGSAELYNPHKDAWGSTGSMLVVRSDATATLLDDGKVLVAGGEAPGFNVFLSSAELYDPRTGRWTATNPMSAARTHATATLLPDGRVLVTGGVPSGTFGPQAELYDPRTGRWSATGSMSTKRRYGAAATLLQDGRVLIVGGEVCDPGCSVLSSAEIYNPRTGSWTLTTPMPMPREDATATTLADGRVLVAGGGTLDGTVATADVYDPTTGTWSATGPMVASRVQHTATLLRTGQVLVAGGEPDEGDSVSASDALGTAEVYDPRSNLWAATAPLAMPRAGHTATLLPTGQVLVTGGRGGGSYDNADAQVYTPGPAPLAAFATRDLAFSPQRVGTSSPARPITVTNIGATPLIISDASIDGADSEVFPISDACAHVPVQPGGSCTITVRLAPDAGGYPTASLNLIDDAPSDPQTVVLHGIATTTSIPNTWSPTGNMVMARGWHTATLLVDGKVLVAGGMTSGGPGSAASAELYDPQTEAWSSTGSMTVGRVHHTATLLQDGKVLVAGGKSPIRLVLRPAPAPSSTTLAQEPGPQRAA